MSPPQQLRQRTSNCSSLLIYRPRKDERLSWPSWLTYSGWFTHISEHPSAAGRAQDSKSTPAKDLCSTAVPRNQPTVHTCVTFCHPCLRAVILDAPCPTGVIFDIRLHDRVHARGHWRHFGRPSARGGPWTRPVNTGSVYRAVVG